MILAGWIFLDGQYEQPKAEKKAFRLARRAAKQYKDPFAYELLGVCYARGDGGTEPDYQKACRVWKKGWEKSNNGACALHLAYTYYRMGIHKEAERYAEGAVRAGEPKAILLLKELQGQNIDPPPTEEKEVDDGGV